MRIPLRHKAFLESKSFWNIILCAYNNNPLTESGPTRSFLLLPPIIRILRNLGVNEHPQTSATSGGVSWDSDTNLLIVSPEFPHRPPSFSVPESLPDLAKAVLHQWSWDFTQHIHISRPFTWKAPCHSLQVKPCLKGALSRLLSVCIGCIVQWSLGPNAKSGGADQVGLPKWTQVTIPDDFKYSSLTPWITPHFHEFLRDDMKCVDPFCLDCVQS